MGKESIGEITREMSTHEWMDIPDDDRVRIRSKEAVARGAARTKLMTLHAYNAQRSFMNVAFNGLTRRPRENGCVLWGASFWELSDLCLGVPSSRSLADGTTGNSASGFRNSCMPQLNTSEALAPVARHRSQ
jgi:hypothetical protein